MIGTQVLYSIFLIATGVVFVCLGFSAHSRLLRISGIVFMLVALAILAMPEINGLPQPGRRVTCMNNLRALGIAVRTYEKRKQRFPFPYITSPQQKPLHSWRTVMLTELGQYDIFENIRLDEPWDSPHNKQFTSHSLEIFRCPSDDDAGENHTSYVAIVGPGTIWDPNEPTTSTDIKDGLSNTILLIEMKNSGIAWAEPRDLDLENLPSGITKDNLLESLSSRAGGFNAVFADSNVRFIPSDIPWDQFTALLTKSGGETIDRDKW